MTNIFQRLFPIYNFFSDFSHFFLCFQKPPFYRWFSQIFSKVHFLLLIFQKNLYTPKFFDRLNTYALASYRWRRTLGQIHKKSYIVKDLIINLQQLSTNQICQMNHVWQIPCSFSLGFICCVDTLDKIVKKSYRWSKWRM